MKEIMTTNEIARRLVEDEYADFSYKGALALARYLEELEDDIGEEMVFDGVAIRCEFSEYASAVEAALGYDFYAEDDEEDDEEVRALAWLEDRTTVIPFSGGVIIQDW